MLNCLIITDYNWDNLGYISKKLSYLSKDTRVNLLHTKQKNSIIKVCNKHDLQIIRHCIVDPKDLSNRLRYVDFCIIFTDFIEYNNYCDFVIDFCFKNNIPYFTFTNINSDYFYNGEICESKFKKIINKIIREPKPRKIVDDIECYLDLIKKPPLNNFEDVREKLKDVYLNINSNRDKKSIKLIDPWQK